MVNGIVTKAFTKPWGDKVFHSLGLNDGKIYGFGTYMPQAKEGDTVEFEAKQNQKGYWEAIKGTLKVTKGVVSEATGVPAGVVVRSGKTPQEKDFWAKKEEREVKNDHLRSLGACRNTAIAFIQTLAQAGALKLPAKEANRQEALEKLLELYTQQFMGADAPVPATPPEEIQVTPVEASADEAWG